MDDSCPICRSGSPALRNPELSGENDTVERSEPSRTETFCACVLILAFLAAALFLPLPAGHLWGVS